MYDNVIYIKGLLQNPIVMDSRLFVRPTAAVLMILLTIVNYLCKYICETEIHVSFLPRLELVGFLLLSLSSCRFFENRYEKVTIILPPSEKWAGLRPR